MFIFQGVIYMSEQLDMIYRKMLERTAEALKANNMLPYIAETKEEALSLVKGSIAEGATVSCGGSVTLAETGIMELLRSGKYNFLDREGKTPEEVQKIYREAFSADVYLTSSNAVTENGELYNVDGNSNRVAAICFGPASVIVVVGRNKVVRTLDDAILRVKRMAAPANAARLGCETYCLSKGECMALASGASGMTEGCRSKARICCSYVVTAQQRIKDRIKVILVNEDIGF